MNLYEMKKNKNEPTRIENFNAVTVYRYNAS